MHDLTRDDKALSTIIDKQIVSSQSHGKNYNGHQKPLKIRTRTKNAQQGIKIETL